MLIQNLVQGIKQKILRQKFERILEPKQIMNEKEQIKQYDNSGDFGGLAIIYELIITKLLQLDIKYKNALDLGCGSGQLICKIANSMPETKFVAIDLSENMIKVSNENKSKYKVSNITFEKMDVFEIDKNFKNKKFDLITCNLTMHHLNTPEEVIKLINQALDLLTDDGVLFIFDHERVKTKKIALWFSETNNNINKGGGDILVRDSYNSILAAFSYKEFEDILQKSNFANYEHNTLLIANMYQYICTKKPNKKINRKPNFPYKWQKKDYFFLKTLFKGIK